MIYISVIIPVYNSEKTIVRCVNSVCAQTYENIEVILVDDGSKDKSAELCDTLAQKDNRITVIHKNQPNMIATITDTISKDGINIANFLDKNRGEFAYSIIDVDSEVSAAAVEDIKKIDGVIKIRVIK